MGFAASQQIGVVVNRKIAILAEQLREVVPLSHYWALFDICAGKDIYLLTATPVNNRLLDLQHRQCRYAVFQPTQL